MIQLPSLRNQTIGVLGLGKTGNATVDALIASGANVIAWDDNEAAREALIVGRSGKVKVQIPASWPWRDVAMLVMSPGIALTHPKPHHVVELAQQAGVEIIGDIELLYRACPDAIYIAITGTNGKSTTTSLIGHILQQSGRHVQVGGNLGQPVLSMEPLKAGDIYVLELSSYQLDLINTTRFNVAVLLNFSPDHLDRHGDMAGYIAAKKHIFERQDLQSTAIVGVDDATAESVCRELIAHAAQKVIPIMTTQHSDKGIWVKEAVLHNPLAQPEITLDLSAFETLRGVHNHQNAAAAYAACWSVGIGHAQITSAMKSYPGLAHRMQLVGKKDGVSFVNDSKATNADAAAKSLGSYETIYWIAGGMAKAGGIESLAPYFPRIKHAFLIGTAQDEFAATLHDHVAAQKCETLDAAFHAALQQIERDGAQNAVILLAPACASFDQFKSFEHRGEVFVALVNQHAI